MQDSRKTINWKAPALIGVLVVVAALAGCAVPSAGSPDLPPGQTGITVSGTGEATGSPDVAFVELGVEVRNPDVGRAVDEANQVAAGILANIIDVGVPEEDIQTVNFNVFRQEARDPQTGQISDRTVFVVSNTVRVKVSDLDLVSEVIGAGLDAGANTVQGLRFGVEDPTALQEEARRKAVQDAQARAEQIAEELGVTVGKPVAVQEGGVAIPQLRQAVALEAFAADTAASAPPISEGQLSVTVGVSVTFEID